jgi:hypothetical protein
VLLRNEALWLVLPAKAVGQKLVGQQRWQHEGSSRDAVGGAATKLAKTRFAHRSISTQTSA